MRLLEAGQLKFRLNFNEARSINHEVNRPLEWYLRNQQVTATTARSWLKALSLLPSAVSLIVVVARWWLDFDVNRWPQIEYCFASIYDLSKLSIVLQIFAQNWAQICWRKLVVGYSTCLTPNLLRSSNFVHSNSTSQTANCKLQCQSPVGGIEVELAK